MDKRKKHFVKLRAEEIRRKPPTKAQKSNQMCTYLKNMANYKHSQLKNKSFKEIQMLFDNAIKWIDSFVPMDSEVVEGSKSQAKGSKKRTRKELDKESVKRQKLEDDAEKVELKLCLEIVPRDDEAINVESLAIKYPIVDWKTHILTEDKMYYEIIRADGSIKFYKKFTAMLDDFDRQDVLDLYRLVKEIFEITSPEGYDRLLWGDLITLFEPINVLLMDTRITIRITVEKKYPLTPEMLSRMLSGKLEVDRECEMAYELLRFTKSQLKKYKSLWKLLLLVIVSTAGEDCRKYSKSLLLLVVKLLLLLLVTTARRVSAVSYNNIDDIQAAGSDTRPPMLDRTDYESWSQRIQLYCRGKENGVYILQSIDQDLNDNEKKRSLPMSLQPTLYFKDLPKTSTSYSIQHEAKAIIGQCQNASLGSQLTKETENIVYDEFESFQDAFLVKISTRVKYYVGVHKLVMDIRNIRWTMPYFQLNSKVYNNNNQNQRKNLLEEMSVAGFGGTQNRAGNANAGQGKPIKCYNCNGIGHIARNCTQPKHPKNSNYFKDKMLLMQAQENGAVLDEEELLFLFGE
ncbi:putative ribonuclease H-like domain-containing protein [Tanacetum coccineum]|uniref:Ribonuclease H-like domain-containing protein n=1 Tax=Tanacetum coccineum TaxID=301880 RepID=A0ABQ5FQQ1_9ASTR